MFTFNRNYNDLEQVAEWLPDFSELRKEVVARYGVPYNDEFKGKIPGIVGSCEDTAIYLLQGLYRQRELDARIAEWLADGYEPIDSVASVERFAHVILYRRDRGGDVREYQDARLVPETNPRQAEVTGKIAALIPKGKRTHGIFVGVNNYAVLGKRSCSR